MTSESTRSPAHDTGLLTATSRAASGAPVIAGVPRHKRRALVVGASSGIGRALVVRLLGEGYRVVAIARRVDLLGQLGEETRSARSASGGELWTHAHDVRHVDEIGPLFESAVRELGGLDLAIYAAGIMPRGGKDEYDTSADLDQIAVNLAGCVAWLNPAAQFFRTQREGTIIGISSIAGDRGRKANPVYCTTKAAMNTYLEALRNRLSECGVHVCTIKPGFVDTAMTKGVEKLFWLISPDEAARAILAAARNRVNVRYVPLRWWLVGSVLRAIPSFVFRRLNV